MLRSTTAILWTGLLVSCGGERDGTPAPKPRATSATLSGGTLASSPDGRWAVASDPDVDRAWVVDLIVWEVAAEVRFRRGDEPGRVAFDRRGGVHVVLRGAGEVASFSPDDPERLRRTAVCPEPRGIAASADDGLLHVACQGGELVSLHSDDGTEARRIVVADDLRDVFPQLGGVAVSRFRAAELLHVDHAGRVTSLWRPTEVTLTSSAGKARRFESGVAWRAIPLGQRRFAVAHQWGSLEDISLIPPPPSSTTTETCTSYGGCTPIGSSGPPPVSCDELVHGVLFAGTPEAGGVHRLSGGVPLDVAVDLKRNIAFVVRGDGSAADVIPLGELTPGAAIDCHAPGERLPVPAPMTVAVTVRPDGLPVFQTLTGLYTHTRGQLPFRVVSRPRTVGQELLHRTAPGSGLACASCHPEAGDDGRVWRFEPIGPRRTQTLRLGGFEGTDRLPGLSATAPFHWDGDFASMEALMSEVLVRRMGGQTFPGELAQMVAWLDTLPPFRPALPDAAAVARGRALFEAPGVACATCHNGTLLTDSQSHDVGTGRTLQTPSLIGVVARAPYMHDGCAATLEDRFGPCGGGDRHGRTSHLDEAQRADLIAYLRSL